MAVRIDPSLDDTRVLTKAVMDVIRQDQRVMFLVPRGQGPNVVQRIRVTVSRARKKLQRQNIPQQHFTLHHSIHPWTELEAGQPGKRFDCVIMWRSRGVRHVMMETLEVIL